MKNENITGGLKKLKQDLAGMSFQEKAEHIWTYYRSWVIVAVAILMLISIFASSFINLSTQTLVAGASINVGLPEDAQNYMGKELEALLKDGNGRQAVYFESAYIDVEGDPQNTYYLVQNMFSLMASKDLDYVLVDEEAMGLLLSQNPYMDLREVFTEEEMKDLKIEYVKTAEGGESIPALVDITDWNIVKKSADSEKKYFFAVILNTPRLDAVKTAFAHLQAYGK